MGASPHGDEQVETPTALLLSGFGPLQQRSQARSLNRREPGGRRRGDGADEQGRHTAFASAAIFGLVAPASTGPAWAGAARPHALLLAGWQQTAELKGSDTVADDFFGGSVALSGSTLVVGAFGHANGAGRTYVFTKAATGWQQTAELKGSDTAAKDDFGGSVALSGSTVVVSASGHADGAGRAYVFGPGVSVTTTTVPASMTTTVPASTMTTLPTSEHSLSVSQAFLGGAGLFSTNGSSCSPNDTVQLEVTDQDNSQLSVYTIYAGAAGVISGGNCVVNFSFGEVPIIPEYEFLWRQPGYSSSWTLASPNGDESLAEVEGAGWSASFTLEPS